MLRFPFSRFSGAPYEEAVIPEINKLGIEL
jgi:hypothetical protein